MKKLLVRCSLLLLGAIVVNSSLLAQPNEVIIIVQDSLTNTPIENANIIINEDKFAITDTSGEFRVKLSNNETSIIITHVGYQDVELTHLTKTDTLQVYMLPKNFMLEEITIGEKYKRNNLLTNSFHHFKAREIKKIPGFLGEKDLMKSLQYLPGVYNPSEANAGLFVRGGTSDQARIYLNGAPLFNPSHLYNFLSTFNPDIVQSMDFYKGGIPAEYGNAGSAVLDIRLRQPDGNRINVNGSVGLLTSRLTLDGPVGNRLSYLVSGRRTYADFFLKYIQPENLAIEEDGFHFYDLNAAVFYTISPDWRITMQGYTGRDFFNTVDIDDQLYGNTLVGLNLTGNLTPTTVLHFDSYYTQYNFFDLGDNEKGILENRQAGLNLKLTTKLNQLGVLKYGVQTEYTYLSPFEREDLETGNIVFTDSFKIKASLLSALYTSYYGNFRSFSWEIGLRANHYQNMGPGKYYTYHPSNEQLFYSVKDTIFSEPYEPIQNYFNVEPRLSISWNISKDARSYVSFDQIHQYQYHFSRSDIIGPWTETTMADKYLKPIKSNQVAAGFTYSKEYELRAEIYYKQYQNILSYSQQVDYYLNRPYEQFTGQGSGVAKGLDLMIKKETANLDGWLSYSLGEVKYDINEANNGKPFHPAHDIRNKINLFGRYAFNQKYELSLGWTFHTGAPVMYPDAVIEYEGLPVIYFDSDDPDKYRKKAYHRADISFSVTPNKNKHRRWKSKWEFSIYNFYGRKNPLFFSYVDKNDYSYSPVINGGLPVYSYDPKIFYLFYITPSVTYSFKF